MKTGQRLSVVPLFLLYYTFGFASGLSIQTIPINDAKYCLHCTSVSLYPFLYRIYFFKIVLVKKKTIIPAWNQHAEHPVIQGERQLAADADAAHRGPPGLQGPGSRGGHHPVDDWEGLSQVRHSSWEFLQMLMALCSRQVLLDWLYFWCTLKWRSQWDLVGFI